MVGQLSTIFTCIEIKGNKSLEFENDKSSDLPAGQRDEPYDKARLRPCQTCQLMVEKLHVLWRAR